MNVLNSDDLIMEAIEQYQKNSDLEDKESIVSINNQIGNFFINIFFEIHYNILKLLHLASFKLNLNSQFYFLDLIDEYDTIFDCMFG